MVTIFILFSCNNNSVSTEKNTEFKNKENSPEINYTLLQPLDTLEGKLIYEIQGFQISSPYNWSIQKSQGADFTMTSFKSQNGNEFGCYFGWHPSYPSPIKFLISEWSDQKIQNQLSKTKYYKEIVKVSIEKGIDKDSSIVYKNVSMYLEVFRLQTKDIWVRKPLNNRIGPIDIAVDFHSDTINEKLHIMGDIKSKTECSELIELAKSIEKL